MFDFPPPSPPIEVPAAVPAEHIPEWLPILSALALILVLFYVGLWALYSIVLTIKWLLHLWRRHRRRTGLYGSPEWHPKL